MSIAMATQVAPPRPALGQAAMAATSLLVAVGMLRLLPLRVVLALAGVVRQVAPRHASLDTAREVITARDWAAAHYPGRATCLDLSLTAFLIAACRGRHVSWCIGCRFNPSESHAWIEVDGEPVGEYGMFDDPFHVTIRL
ncbi:lasso peptide biosynthesis B2 protein [Promicromonospora thailandica]|uniref:Transglutaminase-like superfamily protein n=1 Tax=Promicromonospora thailandica TaxID=765201 RepID=A0A9X2G9X5_9MICO|nr:lasso peptide biosynthesis B2 protein [Promicromonospora thailandica]MCP2264636.1 Transglutaminase-like superfamily protein [Promicromonospora thailandica]BFF20289.1 hypothetical protein GCM10025730_38100 [Promicromonospora thailandica]